MLYNIHKLDPKFTCNLDEIFLIKLNFYNKNLIDKSFFINIFCALPRKQKFLETMKMGFGRLLMIF